MPGSGAIGLPRARIHTHTPNTNTNPTPVRRHHHRRHMPRAILTLAGRQLAAHLATTRHVRAGKRSWTVSIASLGLGGHCSLSDSSSLSLLLALWGKVDRKQICHPFHTRQLQWNTRVASLYSPFLPVPVSTVNLVRPLSPAYPALVSPSPAPSYPSRVQVKPQSKPSLLPRARQVSHHIFAQTA
jgi:hypothetical protein